MRTKIYRFEKPTFKGNRWEIQYTKTTFNDGTTRIDSNSTYFDPDFNIIKSKEVKDVKENFFNEYLKSNKELLIEIYKL